MAIQKEINKENKWSQRVVVSSDGKSIENWSRREIRPSLPELEDNIAEEPEDVTILERQKHELERTQEKQAEKSPELPQIVTISEPATSLKQGSGKKRKVSEPVTPSTTKDKEPPKKKSKSNSGAAVPSNKKMEKCAKCGMQECQLWATDPKTGKGYCYKCHTIDRKLCEYKPETGGKACFRKREGSSFKCSKHQHTKYTSRMDLS